MKRSLRTVCFSSLVFLLPVASSAGVVAQWHFDETPGATVAADSVGSINGTLAGDAGFVAGGISGNAVSMSRSGGGFINMGDHFGFTSGDFSIVAWARTAPDYATSDAIVLSKHLATVVAGYAVGINVNGGAYGQADKAWFYDSNGTADGDDPRSTTSVNDGAWHQIVAIYHAGGASEIYVDGPGVEDSKPADVIGAIAAPFLVGAVDFAGTLTPLFDGMVDELQLYDNALNTCQLQFLFSNPGQTVPADCDRDGVDDVVDNCTLVVNPDQRDTNNDGYGNICDADLNNDGIVNFSDLALFRAAFGTANADADFNGNGGVVNFADLATFRSLFGRAPGPSGLHP